MSVGTITGTTTVKMSTDPRDRNQDGKVTEAEIQAYALAHPDRNKAASKAPKPAAPPEQHADEEGGNQLLDVSA
jgi:hypothetical protein